MSSDASENFIYHDDGAIDGVKTLIHLYEEGGYMVSAERYDASFAITQYMNLLDMSGAEHPDNMRILSLLHTAEKDDPTYSRLMSYNLYRLLAGVDERDVSDTPQWLLLKGSKIDLVARSDKESEESEEPNMPKRSDADMAAPSANVGIEDLSDLFTDDSQDNDVRVSKSLKEAEAVVVHTTHMNPKVSMLPHKHGRLYYSDKISAEVIRLFLVELEYNKNELRAEGIARHFLVAAVAHFNNPDINNPVIAEIIMDALGDNSTDLEELLNNLNRARDWIVLEKFEIGELTIEKSESINDPAIAALIKTAQENNTYSIPASANNSNISNTEAKATLDSIKPEMIKEILSSVDKSFLKGEAAQIVDAYDNTGTSLTYFLDKVNAPDVDSFKAEIVRRSSGITLFDIDVIDHLIVDLAKLIANTIHRVDVVDYAAFALHLMSTLGGIAAEASDKKFSPEDADERAQIVELTRQALAKLYEAGASEENLIELHRQYILNVKANIYKQFPARGTDEIFNEDAFVEAVREFLSRNPAGERLQDSNEIPAEGMEFQILDEVKRLSYVEMESLSLAEMESLSLALITVSAFIS